MRVSMYQKAIQDCTGCTAHEALLTEAFMRLTYKTLDGLGAKRFHREAQECLKEARSDLRTAEGLAKSYGLLK